MDNTGAVLTALYSPGQSSAIGPLPTQPLTEIKMSIVDQIKHIFMPTKCISSSILTMVPFAVIPHENEQLIINVGIRITISDSYDINQRLGLIKLA
jgi:hypothetical protein